MGLPTGYVAATDAAPVAMAMVGAPDIAGRTTMRSEPRSTGADRPQTDVPAPGAPVQAVTMNTLTAGAGVTTAHVAVTNAAPAAIATVGLADTAGRASVRSEPRSTGAEPAPTDLAHVVEALPEPLPGPVQAEQTTSPAQQRTAAVPPPSASKVDPLPTMQPATVSPTGTRAHRASPRPPPPVPRRTMPSPRRGRRRLSKPKPPRAAQSVQQTGAVAATRQGRLPRRRQRSVPAATPAVDFRAPPRRILSPNRAPLYSRRLAPRPEHRPTMGH